MKKPILTIFACFLIGWLHSQIPTSGNVLWLKADIGAFKNASGEPALNGELVEKWEDQSGSGNHFLQDITGQRPRLIMQANYMCSQPILRFEIERRTFLYSSMRLGGAKSIFIVFVSPSLVHNSETLLSIKSPSGSYTEVLCSDISNYHPISFMCEAPSSPSGSVFVNAVGANVAFNPNGNIFGMTFNDGACSSTASYTAYFDAASTTVLSSGLFGRFPGDSTTIGARAPQQNYSFLSGDIAEIIAYNKVLTSPEIELVQQYLVNKYGFFGTCTPLTLQMIDFNTKLEDNVVEMNWKMTHELPNSHFTIEHSNDGHEWLALNTNITSAGINFQAMHQNPGLGYNYYRVKYNAPGGDFQFSPIKKILVPSKNQDLIVYPNPSKDYFHISGSINETMLLSIYDVFGRKVRQATIISPGSYNLKDLPTGTYMIILRGKKLTKKFQFIKF